MLTLVSVRQLLCGRTWPSLLQKYVPPQAAARVLRVAGSLPVAPGDVVAHDAGRVGDAVLQQPDLAVEPQRAVVSVVVNAGPPGARC